MRTLRASRWHPAPAGLSPRDERAAEHLQFIRDTMARAGSFTAMSGRGQMIVGVIGLAAAAVAGRQEDPAVWLATWVGAATISVAVVAVANSLKARRLGIPVFAPPAQRFALMLATPLVAGAILTAVFYQAGLIQRLPGMWLLLFGTGIVTGGAMSVDVVPVMGVCFMLVAVAAFLLPASLGDPLMAVGFGGLNLVFGGIIAVKHHG